MATVIMRYDVKTKWELLWAAEEADAGDRIVVQTPQGDIRLRLVASTDEDEQGEQFCSFALESIT